MKRVQFILPVFLMLFGIFFLNGCYTIISCPDSGYFHSYPNQTNNITIIEENVISDGEDFYDAYSAKTSTSRSIDQKNRKQTYTATQHVTDNSTSRSRKRALQRTLTPTRRSK